MTSIAATADVHTTSTAKSRNLALDRARTFLTLVVLLHHAVIPYTYFGHTDPKSWIGFDMVVLATDSFFMAMFFFLSGLFVWPGLGHKALVIFLRDRLLRLGLPFAVAAFTVIPIAYYAISLRQHPEIGFSEFWWTTITSGPWPSGPIWFVWVLLMFDLTASLLYRMSPHLLDPINHFSEDGFKRPAMFFLLLLSVSLIAYVPALLYFGPNRWFQLGPLDVQASRILLYGAYFFIGAGIGAATFQGGVLGRTGRLARSSWGWSAVTLVPYCLLWVMIYIKRELLGNPPIQPQWYLAIYGFFFVAFSAAILFAILAYFLRFKDGGSSALDPMQADAYGMFLVHYPIALWLQYWLFDYDLPAFMKGAIVFALTVAFSWMLTRVLRQIPGATKVL